MKFKTVIFDFDSTLVTIEGIDELARMKGVYNQVSTLTDQAMNGSLAFEDVFYQRLELIQPSTEDLQTLGKLYQKHITRGAANLLNQLKKHDIDIYVITGGYLQAITPTTTALDVPSSQVFAIELAQNGVAMTKVSKNQILTLSTGKHDLIKHLSLTSPIAYIGDGITDTYAKPLVDCFIGFGGVAHRPQVKTVSDHYVDSESIYSVYNYLNT